MPSGVIAAPVVPTADPRSSMGMAPATRRRVLSLLFFILFVGLWEGSVRAGLVNPQLLVAPSGILSTFWADFQTGRLLLHAQASVTIFVGGYVLAVVLAVPLGLLLGASRRLEWAMNPYLLGMYATPSQAWLPLLIIALGIGAAPKIALVALFVFFVVTLNTISAVKTVNPTFVKAARSFSASRWAIFTKIVLPAASPLIVTGLRLGVGRAVIGVFLAEMVGADRGIGFYILRSGTEFRVDRVFVGVFILVIASVTLTEGMRLLELRMTPWRQRTQL